LYVQWYLLRAASQSDIKIAIFVNDFVVYHGNVPVMSNHLQYTTNYQVAAHRRDHDTTIYTSLLSQDIFNEENNQIMSKINFRNVSEISLKLVG
jgi:hypothetical protein